jgi:predicted N-acetyltransferase YhbS
MFPSEPGRVNPSPSIWASSDLLSPRCCDRRLLAAPLSRAAWRFTLDGMIPSLATDPALWPAILALLGDAFAYMKGRIDPPSSLRDMTQEALTEQAKKGEIWIIGPGPNACIFLTPKPQALYLGKLAVAPQHRHQGLARTLIDLAETRARALKLPMLELQTRVELTENHATFQAMGFFEIGRSAHPGYNQPTSITYQRLVPALLT